MNVVLHRVRHAAGSLALVASGLCGAQLRGQSSLTLAKPAWSTSNDYNNLFASRAVDADLDTFWISGYESTPWLAVDLQAHTTVNRVKVRFPDSFPTSFKWTLQVLNTQGSWTDLCCEGDVTAAVGPVGSRDLTFTAARGRFFRIKVDSPGSWGTQIHDFELFEPTGTKLDLNTAAKPLGAGSVTRTPDAVANTSGSTVSLRAVPATNHKFIGWSGDASGTTNPLSVTLTAGKRIVANFASTTSTNVALGRPATALATAPDSDTALAVDGNGATAWHGASFSDDWYAVDLETNCTVSQAKVTFEAANYPSAWTLQVQRPDGTWVDLFTETLTAGGTRTATFPPVTARRFRAALTFNWDLYTGIYGITEFQLLGQTTTNYTVQAATNLSGAGTVTTPVASGYAPGGTASLTATPASGYVFTGWSGDAAGTANPLALTMDADKAVTANFASTTSYKVTTPISGNGSVTRSPNATWYSYRSSVALTSTGSGNWWFTGWSGDVTGTANPLNLTVAANTTAVATFATASCGKPDAQVDSWNDGIELGFIQPNNNCYNYATNTRTDTFAQPGRWSGNALSAATLNATTLMANVKMDGLVPTTKDAVLPYGRTKICLVLSPYYDFHWYRQNANGLWSHKPGSDSARDTDESGNLITSPDTADRGVYTVVVGYYSICSGAEVFGGHSTIQ